LNATQNTWPWKILLAVILIGLAAATWGSVQRIDYQWRWYRVPQYFLYKSEDLQKIPFDGTVTSIKTSAQSAEVIVTSDTGEKQTLTVDAGTVNVSENESLFEGDAVGSTSSWEFGPLVWVSGPPCGYLQQPVCSLLSSVCFQGLQGYPATLR